MRAYEACRHLAETIGPRWIGSEGEKRAGDWIEAEFRRLGLETRRLWFDCPAWDYRGTWLVVDGARVAAGAQMFSPACDVQAELAAVAPDGKGAFTGDVARKIAVFREKEAGGVVSRCRLAHALREAGALAAVVVSALPETWSTKMLRDPDAGLPAAGVSATDGATLYAKLGSRARLTIDALPRAGRTSVVVGETGLADAPVVLVGAHYDASPYSAGARDNAAGVGILLDLAGRFSKPTLARRLRFCAFSGHEFGGNDVKAFGSKHYVMDHPQELKRVELMFNLDGAAGPKGSRLVLAVFGGDALLARMEGFAASRGDVEARAAKGGGSDHGVFVEAGIEAVWLQSFDDGAYDTTAYHSPLDDMRWVDAAEIERSAEVAFGAISNLMGRNS